MMTKKDGLTGYDSDRQVVVVAPECMYAGGRGDRSCMCFLGNRTGYMVNSCFIKNV
jgi:hypothetical protein